jgi:hypothetical protein
MQDPSTMPRTVWFFWSQGLREAPQVVRKCYESWTERNPGWRVVVLDKQRLAEFASADYEAGPVGRLPGRLQADLARLDLLARHGGVWADATCFCVQPLDDWLLPCLPSGFFAFDRPGPDRLLSTWFLAAQPGNALVSETFALMRDYLSRPMRLDEHAFLVKALTRLLRARPRTRGWWFDPALRAGLGTVPYFALHYGFEKVIGADPGAAEIWRQTPRISADGPHRLITTGLLAPVPDVIRAEIDRREVPVYKTSWKLGTTAIPADSVLGYLLGTVGN